MKPRQKATRAQAAPEDTLYLTADDLVDRYRGVVTKATLSNWRSAGEGPAYSKIGGQVLYPFAEVLKWESTRTAVKSKGKKK